MLSDTAYSTLISHFNPDLEFFFKLALFSTTTTGSMDISKGNQSTVL
jgi:hypothetical protein